MIPEFHSLKTIMMYCMVKKLVSEPEFGIFITKESKSLQSKVPKRAIVDNT